MLTIYHNPRCNKSRQTLALIEEKGAPHTVVLYLENPPPVAAMAAAIKQLGRDVVLRKNEPAYKEYVQGKELSDADLAALLTRQPILLERPLVVSDTGAMVMGRPPENVQSLLD